MQFGNMARAGGSGQRLRDQAIALSDTQPTPLSHLGLRGKSQQVISLWVFSVYT